MRFPGLQSNEIALSARLEVSSLSERYMITEHGLFKVQSGSSRFGRATELSVLEE